MKSPSKEKAFPSNWFVNLSEKDQEDLKRQLTYGLVSRRLIEIIEGLQKSGRPSRKDYDNPSWAYLQAHKNGEFLAYETILSLLRPTKE